MRQAKTMTPALQPHEKVKKRPILGDFRFVHLLGQAAWARLPHAVSARFSQRLAPGQSLVYRGKVLETRLSLPGHMLAHLLRLVGAPLPLDRSTGGEAAVVTVTEAADGNGQYWTRQYNRRAGFPQVIHSQKSFAGPTGLEERVGGGLGMTLWLKANERSLQFCSQAYFIDLFGVRLYLPGWLTPGRLTVGHHDLGNGQFDFTLDLVHPVLGELVHQRARFSDMPHRDGAEDKAL